jgi:trk system potassium uptake protein TrkA
MGERVAKAISGGGIFESIELDPNYSIIEITAPPDLIGKTLTDANLRARYGVTVIAIKGRDGVNIAPMGDDRIQAGDLIAVIGANERLLTLQT